jgi:hypothetical protein
MEAVRQSWTDDRLDDFRSETERRFDEVDRRFDKVEAEISDLRSETKAGFESLNARFDARFDSLQRVMLQFSGALIAVLIGFIVTQV